MNPVRLLRATGIIEGVSFVLLLFVAMPLKYVYGFPIAVRITGMIDGILFLAFLGVLARTHLERDWRISLSLRVLGAALCPFGFLLVDRRLREEIRNTDDAAGNAGPTTPRG